MAKKDNFRMFYAVSLAWQLGFIIAVPLAVFVFLGFLADNFFGTRPFFLIIGVLVSLAVTFYEVYRLLAPLIDNKE